MHVCRKFLSQAHRLGPILKVKIVIISLLYYIFSVTLILRPCEGQLELWQLSEVPVHVLVLADLLEGEVGLAQSLVGPLEKAEREQNELKKRFNETLTQDTSKDF